MERREEEEAGEFGERVQQSLMDELKLQRSEVTPDDVTAWLEGQLTTEQQIHVLALALLL